MTDANQKPDSIKSGLTGLVGKVKSTVTSALDTTKDVVTEKAQQAKDYLKDDLEKTKADALNIADTAKEKVIDAKDMVIEKTEISASELKSRLELAYDSYAAKVSELYQAGQEKSREAMDKALDVAKEQLSVAGEVSAEQADKFKDYLKRDLEQTQEDMKVLGDEAQKRLHPSRLGAGAVSVLSSLFQSASKGFEFLSEKTEKALTYHTGEVTSAGTLTCLKCEQTLKIEKTTHIPPCPKCHGTEFRKSY